VAQALVVLVVLLQLLLLLWCCWLYLMAVLCRCLQLGHWPRHLHQQGQALLPEASCCSLKSLCHLLPGLPGAPFLPCCHYCVEDLHDHEELEEEIQ